MYSTFAENKKTSNKYEIRESNGFRFSVYDFSVSEEASKICCNG